VPCRLVLLGSFSLQAEDGAELALPTRKDRLLLAHLALSAGGSQARDRLAGLLWGDRGEVQARDSLRQSLAALRQTFRQVGLDPIRTDRESVFFDPASIEIDAIEFAASARTAPGKSAALYRGELLEGLDGVTSEFEEWLRPERERLADLAVRALEDATASCSVGASADALIELGRRLLAKDRLREPVYRALMRLQERKGDRVEALKLYAACRTALQQELGISPDTKTENLHRNLLAAEPDAYVDADTDGIAPDRLSIAVLPFNNMSGDPQQQYFSDGFTEDIITELSRFRSLFVLARNSSFVYRGDAVDVRKVGRELGVRFVVEGSVRRVGETIRISAQLLETASANHLWAERYDRPIADLYAVQDEVVQTIVATVAGRLEEVEIKGAKRRRTGSLPAYECLLRGIEHARGYGPDDNRLARELFERAVQLDPQFGLAYAYLALVLLIEHGFADAPRAIKIRAHDLALTGVRLDPNESRCHQFLGQSYLYRQEHDQALFHLERGTVLNPNDAHGIAQLGFALALCGRAEEGIRQIHRAMRLNPFHPPWYWADLSVALYTARRYEEALEACRRTVGVNSKPWTHARLAACYAWLGQMEEAHIEVAEVLRQNPDFHLSGVRLSYKNPADTAHIFDGMRKAGLPD
jgi:TolB-like protein/DNA-binding SARP family transcriptional activator/cytochrome c-type biogenesis protein CcmH/NrfG